MNVVPLELLPPPPKERRLILFGRYPVPGYTKTRLIPALGPLGAAELQRYLTEKTLTTLINTHIAPVDFVYSGGEHHQMRRWLGRQPIHLLSQGSGDLGQRMHQALARAFDQGAQQVVLVGTDVPDMTPSHIATAFEALNTKDLVLGPAEDGGYWLIGCKKCIEIFSNIDWGTPGVLNQTLAAAKNKALSVQLLPPLNDIDTQDDLHNWKAHDRWEAPYLSIVVPTLNEADNIGLVCAYGRTPDIEVIVADGSSPDGTARIARQAGAKVVETQGGRALQQNRGAEQAVGRVLLFLHADTRLPNDFGERIFDLLMDKGIILGAFRFKTDYGGWLMRFIEATANLRARWMNLPYGDQALFMRKSTFNRVGGFAQVPIAEDLFLVKRVSAMGRIAIADRQAITSGRRWRQMGILRTTFINYMIAAGCLLGIDPKRLAPLYRWGKSTINNS